MINNEKILVLAPHTDDGEFGCGGSIARFIDQGAEVYYATFSLCEESVPDGFSKDVLAKELRRATKVLGISESNLLIFGYPVRRFAEHRQYILEELVTLCSEISPTLVFMPSFNDLHQDHHIIAQEGIRAFKKTSIMAYEMPWNNITFSTQLFIKLAERHIETKIAALEEYVSQKEKPYANANFIRSLANTRGVSIDTVFAEAFEVVRWIIK